MNSNSISANILLAIIKFDIAKQLDPYKNYTNSFTIFLKQTLEPDKRQHIEQELFKIEAEQKDFPIAIIYKFSSEDFARNNAVLQTAHSIFKRYKLKF
ncbi:exportin-2-like protein [Rhizophagus irregularis DAOM 181602=DAOM 197198]|nr:exportin-2-like protein [Rhizophagus irregularis DAOM 181602=DAOM 197198]